MSTKMTIGYNNDKGFHLYEECFESDNVYLQLDGTSHKVLKEELSGELTISIDVQTWRMIVESWINSHWGKNPDQDYKKLDDIDNQMVENFLNGWKRRTNES